MFKSRYSELLKDRDILRWYENVARGSKVTADVYLRRLGNFCKAKGITPKGLASMPEKDLRDLFMDFVSSAEKEEYAGSYIESVLKALKSWLAHNDRYYKGKIKIKGARDAPTLANERVPTQDELRRVLRSGDKKTRATCVLVAHSGLRIESLSNYSRDGLKVRDLPEMVLHGRKAEFRQTPAMVVVRRPLSKAGHQYFTFLGEEGCEYLKEWLEQRIEQGEKLTSDSPIVTSKFRTMRTIISNTNVRDTIRGAIRRAGFSWRPYVLRSYFDTQLMLAESKGLVIRDYRKFWMGHKGDIEARYTTNKGRLPKEVIEDMREAYQRSQKFLETTTPEGPNENKIREEFKKQLLLVAGFKPEDVGKMDLLNMGDDEFQAMIRQRLMSVMENNGARQKIVPIDEIEKHIAQGWEFVAALPNEKAIIKLPA